MITEMAKKKKHVLIICHFASPNIGGVESHLDKLIKEATAKGYYISLITYQPLTTKTPWEKHRKSAMLEILRARWLGMGIFPKLEKYFPLQFLYLFPGLFVKSFIYYLKNHRVIDVIHAHGLAAATIAKILKMLYKKKIIMSTHAIYSF